jgi:uroporphyrinogen-III decarboxylase
VDPVQDRLDLSQVKQSIGSQICLMGGLNSGIMLSNWEQAQIEEAVDYAIETLVPGDGFILYPVDAIFDNQPWEKVDILIKRWRQHWTGHLNENSLSTAGNLAKGGFE